MNTTIEIVIRTVTAFALIMIIARILGKQTITQLTYHDFVSTITLGAITANLAFNTDLKSWNQVTSLLTFSGIAFIVAVVSLRNRHLRKWVSGRPTIVMEDGKILEHNLRKLRFTLDTLNQELREKDIFDINEVEYAVLELNGKLSVLKKPQYRQVTKSDLAIKTPSYNHFPIELIMDGKPAITNLENSGLDQDWLNKQLKKRGLTLEEVCYAVKGTNGSVYFDLYRDQLKHPINTE
ncbi:DUF421 domain-containing protein [Paenibacillus montanisoli]|uniref:DUF421 domain-containing protein n=1 Tax=Paenibacillus montanisoli TaxID=2081970 RepID=A0A328TZN1_9BACL|nr:DUF421 domain-containing protein [Paenibacillus montanisoli]RAP74631.1 hypothetical protein DL346_21495 [Paenibacillus montanisoli]